MKLDAAHSPVCLFSANSRKQIERATRTRGGSPRIKSIIFLGPLLSLHGGNRNRKLVRITVTDLHRFDYTRQPELVFPPTRFPLFSFFFHRSSANFRSSTPLSSPPPPFFFRSRMLQNWIRSNFFISPYPNFKIKIKNKPAYLEIYFSIKKQYHYKRMSNLYQFTCKHGKKVLILFHCIFSERKQFTHLLIT